MSTLSNVQAYLRFAFGLRSYLRDTATLDDIQTTIQQQLNSREENFIELLKMNVFDHPQSPYLPLFRLAKLTFADVEKMVRDTGIEQTLNTLYDEDVYITFEEYKGRIPIRRGELEYTINQADLDSPNLTATLFGETGGSTGKSTRTKLDFDFLSRCGQHSVINRYAHNLIEAKAVIWFGFLPETSAISNVLMNAHFGNVIPNWFSTTRWNESNTGWFYVVLTYLMIVMVRLHRFKFPLPQYVTMDNPLPIVHTITDLLHKEEKVILITTTSKAVRVCLCAKEHGIDLTGMTVFGLSEPSTQAKIRSIEASGAQFLNWYGTTDVGDVGMPCANPVDGTDVHFLRNHLAMIQRPQQVIDQSVDAFHFTTLLPGNPKTLLNVQLDDFGIVEERDCGCPLYQMGFTTHIRQMSSFRKLTGEGVTLVGSDMIHILEHILPSKFGGSLLDYQLVEEENDAGFTKLILYVAPSIALKDEQEVLDVFLDAMKNSMPSVRLAQAEFRSGDVVSIKRANPLVTERGKYFPIRTINIKS